jgi:carbamoyltransferase
LIVLGLNIFHANASAVILVNGKVEFAIEEERINRIKNSGGFPKNSIIECLKYCELNVGWCYRSL